MTIKKGLPALLITGAMLFVLSLSLINFNQSRNPQTKAANQDYGDRIRIINATGTQYLNTEFLVPLVLRNTIDAADLVINYDSTKMAVVVEPQVIPELSLLTQAAQINLINGVNSRVKLSLVTTNNLAAANLGDGKIIALLKITPKVVGNIQLSFSPQTIIANNGGINVTGFTIPSTGFVFGTYNIITPATLTPASTATPIPTQTVVFTKRVNIGGPAYTDSQGNSWLADKAYSAGTYGYVGGSPYSTTSVISGTSDQTLYKTERYNMSSYKLDVPNGDYNVTLKFAEIYVPNCVAGKRGFNVDIQGTRVLTNFDIFVDAGGCNKADGKIFRTNVANGILTIGFSNIAGKDVSAIKAIEISSIGDSVTTPTPISTSTPPPTNVYAKRVNIGGPAYTDSQGNSWLADKAYSAGTYGYVGGSPYSTVSAISGTADQALYKTERYNMSTYKIDVPNGNYNVTLKFAEIYVPNCVTGKRVFNVDIQGVRALTNFDIFVNAGRVCNRATEMVFPVNVTNGIITVGFSNIAGKDFSAIKAIEISSIGDSVTTPTPISTSTPPPTNVYAKRVNIGGPAYTDSQSKSWLADKAYSAGTYGYIGGGQYSTVSVISGTSDQTLYKTERYNMSTYKIDVPNGNYKVTLKFAEIYSPNCAVGKRVFNVDIQGIRALTNFDIFVKAGKICNRAIDQTFTANVANGVLTIGFARVSGDVPSIKAIEVLQQ